MTNQIRIPNDQCLNSEFGIRISDFGLGAWGLGLHWDFWFLDCALKARREILAHWEVAPARTGAISRGGEWSSSADMSCPLSAHPGGR